MKKSDAKAANEALELIGQAKAIIETILVAAQDALEGRTDKWLESEKGEQAQAELETLEGVFEQLETAEDELAGLTGEAQ